MAQSPRSIDHLLAYSMFPLWGGAILMLLILLALAQIPATQRVEEQRMKDHLQRVFKAVQGDIRAINAFSCDWGVWDETYQFLAKPNRAYINSNLLDNSPMGDFELNVLSYMDLHGDERWTRTMLPDSKGPEITLLPFFLDKLKAQLLQESRQRGLASLSGLRGSQWGPLIFSLQPVTNSARSAKPNGFLLVIRWLDKAYMAELAERTALAITLSEPSPADQVASFKHLKAQMRYRLVDLGLRRIRVEGLLSDGNGDPVLTLTLEEDRDVLKGAMEGAIWTFIGMVGISLFCILVALMRLRTIVLKPLAQLVRALQQFGQQPDMSVLPIIDSSREMALLSGKFREMAAKISFHHSALQAHSSRMELAAYTDPLTKVFNRRYLESWLLARYELTEPRWLVILDLDHFKQVNDRFGHDMGDRVLCQLADLLRGIVLAGEPLIRLGGEEFLLLLTAPDAINRIEALRRQIATYGFGSEAVPLRMTVSLGYCCYPLHRELEDSFWPLSFKLADIALYQAKQEGRNRWRGYSGTLAEEQWRLSPEQIVAGGFLTCQTSTDGRSGLAGQHQKGHGDHKTE